MTTPRRDEHSAGNDPGPAGAGFDGPLDRARTAQQRAEELRRQTRAALASGKPVTAATVATARERAERSLERAKAAHLSAAKHHRDAESAHLRAAAAHEQAALGADDLHGSAHQDAAEQHREAAEAHEAAAALQFDEYLAAGKVRPTPLPPSAAERR